METFQQFIKKYPARKFAKGEIILLKGDTPEGVYLIESGYVKTYSITANGDERLVALDGKNEDFPIGYAFGLINKAEYFYDGFTDCTVHVVPRERYLEHLHSNPQSFQQRHLRLSMMLLSTLSRVSALEQSKATEKVAHVLLYIAEQAGVILRPYRTRIKVSITQQEIANSLGLTRETTSVELKKLQLMKLIDHSRKSYTLYTKRIQKYLEDHE